MYAVIETGGKQHRVEVGSLIEVEKLDLEQGQAVTLDRVLLVADEGETAIGRPFVPNATVEAEVVRQVRGEKIDVFKYRPKARRRVKKGHRQDLTVLRIADIRFNGKSAAELARQAAEAAKSERMRLEEAAARQAAADRELAARLAAKQTRTPSPKGDAGPTGGAPTEPGVPAGGGETEGRPTGRETRGRARRESGTAAQAKAEPGDASAPVAKAPAATAAEGPEAAEPTEAPESTESAEGGGAATATADPSAVGDSPSQVSTEPAEPERPRPRRQSRATKKDE